MSNVNDLWYAAKMTKIIYMPHSVLETFGETAVQYRLLTQLDDGHLCLRTGVVKAARPRIVTPHYVQSQALENFGESARRYFEDLISRKDGSAIIQYGLQFQKEDRTEETIGGNIMEVAESLAKEAQDATMETRGVLTGDEKYWEIALVFFLKMLVAQSIPYNAREMAHKGLFAMRHGIPLAICQELDSDFNAVQTKEQADALGNKLRDFGVFDEYEDRFFDLYSRFC